ncbi:MAG TPA: hypothetical protein VHY35_06655 [Stellaceae bacterium]|jgi:hypothetical protein|nr:hypothetical protein [Stellaceae bacterium]
MQSNIVALIIGALLGTCGTLGSQLIATRAVLRTKRLELFYGRKADAYKVLFEKATDFGVDPKNLPKFLMFQSALHVAVIVASENVADILDNPRRNGLHVSAVRLRAAGSDDEIQRIQMHEWHEAMEATKKAVRADLAGFATGHLRL